MAFRDDIYFYDMNEIRYIDKHGYDRFLANHICVKTKTYRDQSSPTTPNESGDYWEPTNYEAFFAHYSSPSFSVRCGEGNDAVTCYGEGGGTYYPVNGDLAYWGCQTNKPHKPNIPASVISEMEASLIDQVYSNDLNLGQTVGEMNETLGFLYDLMVMASNLIDALTSLKRGGASMTFKTAEKLLPEVWRGSGAAASAYNGGKYGLLPLMNDLYAGVGILANGVPKITGRAYAKRLDNRYSRPTVHSAIRHHDWRQSKFERGCLGEIFFQVKDPYLFQLDRFGLADPISLVWELLPLSFVIDWFTGMGNFLNAVGGPIGLRFVKGYRTEYVDNKVDFEYMMTFFGPYQGTLPTISGSLMSMKRYEYWSFPVPEPYIDLGWDFTKVLGVLALARARG